MNLKYLRKKFKLTQKELATILGVTQAKVSDLENNKLEMKVSELGKLIKALNLNSDFYESLIDNQVQNAKPPKKYI